MTALTAGRTTDGALWRARLLSVVRLARSTGWRLRRVGRRVRGLGADNRLGLSGKSIFGGTHDLCSPTSSSAWSIGGAHDHCVGNAAHLRVVFRAAAPLLAIRYALEREKRGSVMNPNRSASRRDTTPLLSCPRCGLSIRPKIHWLAIEHCPRCLARAHVAVGLISSPPTDAIVHRSRPALRVDSPGARAAVRSSRR